MKGTHVSTSEDMTHGSNSDKVEEALERMENTFDDKSMFHDGSAASEIAKVLQLDVELGLAQDGDKIVLHPLIGSMLFVTARIAAPQELAAIAEKTVKSFVGGPEPTDEEDEALMRLSTTWFEVCFDLKDPESGEPYQYHPILQGKTFTVRMLTEEEMLGEQEFMCASVRADGTLISASKPKRTKF